MLFVERGEAASEAARSHLNCALEGTEYRYFAAVLEHDYNNAVCIGMGVTEFPTMMLLDSAAQELYRTTNVRQMQEETLRSILQTISSYRTTHL